MRKGSFYIDNIHSGEIKSLIQERPHIPTPRRKVDLRDVPGRSGAITFDEETYGNVETTILLFTKGKDEDEVQYLKEKITNLFDSGDYLDFSYYVEPEKIYKIKSLDLNFLGNGSYPLILPYTINISIKPFKYSINERTLNTTEPITLHNPSPYISDPIITVFGNGDFRLFINDKEFPFRNVDDYIIIDSQAKHAYKEGLINRNNRMYSVDFPKFHKGENRIDWTGNIEKINIQPRWCWLV